MGNNNRARGLGKFTRPLQLSGIGKYTMPKSKIEMQLLAATKNPKGGRQPAVVEQKNEKSLKKVLRYSGK